MLAAMTTIAGNPLFDWIDEHTEPREFTGANSSVFRYRVAEKAAPEGGRVPLVLFMHGAGERGAAADKDAGDDKMRDNGTGEPPSSMLWKCK